MLSKGGIYLDDMDPIEEPERDGSPLTRDELNAIFKRAQEESKRDSELLLAGHKATNHMYHIIPVYRKENGELDVESFKLDSDYLYFVSKESCKTKARANQVARGEIEEFNNFINKQ